jgi:hypothetical protein
MSGRRSNKRRHIDARDRGSPALGGYINAETRAAAGAEGQEPERPLSRVIFAVVRNDALLILYVTKRTFGHLHG